MASPWKHPATGSYYLRERVPQDLAGKLKGRKVAVPVGGQDRQVTLNETVKVSLGTKEPKVARELYREAAAAVQEMWTRFRQEGATGPVRLTHRQVLELAGEYYRDLVAAHEENPDGTSHWDLGIDIAEELEESRTGRENLHGEAADRLLQRRGLIIDVDSRKRLLFAMNGAFSDAVSCLRRRSEGDYSPDPKARRFPESSSPSGKEARTGSAETVTLSELLELWKADHVLEGGPDKTVRDFRQKVDSLIAFLGHEDAHRVTSKQIADWTEHLRHEEGLSARTVGQKYLVAVKRIFTVGKRKFRITDNPAADVTVEVRKAARTRSPGFTDGEAKAILSAALKAPEALGKTAESTKLAIRWGTWLCAYTGARIGEIMQLRSQDVEVHEGVPCIRITPEAGSTKTGDQRLVPLHSHLIEMGFLDWVRSRPEGYLFFTLKAGTDPVTRAGTLGKKVGKWVRDVVGITDPHVQPNHAWRPRLKTELRKLSIERDIMDAIQGHKDGTASKGYGDQPVEPLHVAIQKLPRYEPD